MRRLVQAGRIWKPDIMLYNNADRQYDTGVTSTNAIVASVGAGTT